MTYHLDETKTVIISGISATILEVVVDAGFERVFTFGIQSTIGLLTCTYLIIKIFKQFKQKEK